MSDDLTGRLVFSTSGRDKGLPFILVEIGRQGFYLLADGRLHKIEKPKLKNPRHVQLTNRTAESIRSAVCAGKKPENYAIQYAIRQMLETAKMSGERGSLENAEG